MNEQHNKIQGGVLDWPDTTSPEFDTHDGLGAPWDHGSTGGADLEFP